MKKMISLALSLVCIMLFTCVPTLLARSNDDTESDSVSLFASNLKICGVDIGIAANTHMQFTTSDGTNSESGYYYKDKYLGASQCFGFARWCQYKLFGAISLGNFDSKYTENSNKDFYRVSANGATSVAAGSLTTSNLKAFINASKPGAHLRTNSTSSNGQHSLVITEITDKGFSIAQCNGSNNNEYSGYKQNYVGTYTYTWSSYVSSTYGKRGIAYIEMPYNYKYDKPATPTIKSHSNVTETSATLSWNSVSGAKKYKLQYRQAGQDWDTDGISKETTSTSYNVTGLESGKLYWFRLYAINDAGTSGKSENYGVYLKPKAPTISIVDTNSIKVKWSKAEGNTQYEVLFRKSGVSEWSSAGKFESTYSYTITGLIPGTQYYFRIKEYNLDNTSVVSGQSDSGFGYTKLSMPTVTDKSSNTVSLQLTRGTMDSAFTYTYRIWRKEANSQSFTSIATVSNNSYTDTGLNPNTTYNYYFDVLKDGEYCIHSEWLTVTTNLGYLNLGDNFAAYITQATTGLALTQDEDTNVAVRGLDYSYEQRWIFERQNDGSYIIKSKYNNKFLDVYGGMDYDGNNVAACDDNGGGANQRWFIIDNNGTYLLKPASGNCVLDVANGHVMPVAEGTNVQVCTNNGSDAQKFYINKIDKYYLDVNGLLDGENMYHTMNYGTFDVYINGELKADDVSDYWGVFSIGTYYEVNDIKPFVGRTYNGVVSEELSGTVKEEGIDLRLAFDTAKYHLDVNGLLDGVYVYDLTGLVTFDVYINGSIVKDDVSDYCIMHPYGTVYEINDIKSTEGYTYQGTVSESLVGMIGENSVVLELVLETNKYTVKYDGNGATGGTTASSIHTYDVEQELTANGFVRDKFKFVGWNTKSDGTGTNYSDGESVKNLTAIANGEVTLYAQWESTSIPVENIALNRTNVTLTEGETETLTATVSPDNATDKSVTWISSNESVATVENGKVTAISEGEAIITATSVDGGYSANCTVTVSAPEIDVDTAVITVGDTSGRTGENITIPIIINENPGLAGFNFKINFDNGVLTPVSIEKGSALASGVLTSNIQQIGDLSSLEYVTAFWSNPANVTDNGEILLITFTIAENAEEGTYPVTITYEEGDVTNQNYEDVALNITNGSVEVKNVMLGDVYKDGKVNTKDSVKLGQYLAGWAVTLTDYEKAAADVFADNKINTKDSVKLGQYLAGWDIELMSLMEEKSGKITFKAESAEAIDGYVDIPVVITENDGVAGFNIKVNYDNALLTPVSITKGDALTSGIITSNIQQGGDLTSIKFVTAFWNNPSNITTTGTAFTVRFKVVEGVTENIPITLSYEEGDICDQNFNDLEVTVTDGEVFIEKELIYDYTVHSITGTAVNGKFYAEAEITKNSDRNSRDMIIIAVYKDSVMIDMVYMKADFNKGQTVTFGGILQGEEGVSLKAFVWDSLTAMNCLSNVIEK